MEVVDDIFTYTRRGVGTTEGTEEDRKARLDEARRAFVILNIICNDRNISLRTKLRIPMSSMYTTIGGRRGKQPVSCVKKL